MKRLMKSSNDRAVFGVCGGIAEYFGISSFLVRVIFLFALPAAFWIYLILNLVLTEKRTI